MNVFWRATSTGSVSGPMKINETRRQLVQVLYSVPLALALGGLVVATPALANYNSGGGGGGMAPPDPDGDGVAYEDHCPHEPGPAENNGCPESYLGGVASCINTGVATATPLQMAGCLLMGGMAAILITGIMTGVSAIAIPAAAAAWAPIASLVGGISVSLLCACLTRGI